MLHPIDIGRSAVVSSYVRPLSRGYAGFRQVPPGGRYILLVTQTALVCLRRGEGRRSHAVLVSRVHELFGGQRRAACTLPFLYPTVGWLELGPRYHVQLRYFRRHALLQRATEVQQLPETPDLPPSATELLLGLQPRLRLPALQGGRRPLREAALGLLHPRAVSALQPVAVTIRELSEPPPYAHERGRLVSSLLQVDLPVPDDRALESSPRDL